MYNSLEENMDFSEIQIFMIIIIMMFSDSSNLSSHAQNLF